MTGLPPPFEPHRFESTVPYYARYRLGYPSRLIRRVVVLLGLRPGDPVLDLGCGPGLLALPLARAGLEVTAADPEPEMLKALQEAAESEQLRIQTLLGSSLALPEGPFRAVVMGRAFHWMERAATLENLDKLIAPGGAVVLFEDDHPNTVENRWRKLLDEVANRYGAAEEPHRRARSSADYRSHESILLESAFPVLESLGVIVERELSADDIVGLAFSLSVTARHKLGERAAAFESELRAALAELSPDGRFREIAELRALAAWRGSDGCA
jgi:ubiquinone/menaquinone biosynthesis C-methylase UbiE